MKLEYIKRHDLILETQSEPQMELNRRLMAGLKPEGSCYSSQYYSKHESAHCNPIAM